MKKQTKKVKIAQQEIDTATIIADMQAQIAALTADNELAWYGFNWYRAELQREEKAANWYQKNWHTVTQAVVSMHNRVANLSSELEEVKSGQTWWKRKWQVSNDEVIRLENKLARPWWKIVLFGKGK